MGKFSKNGKPLGRVSANANKNKAWTKEEDNYLALALEENKMTMDQVASRLGRSKNSITFRKHILGLEGRFPSSRKGVKYGPRTKSGVTGTQKPQHEYPEGLQLMTLESGVPLPTRGSKTNEEERNKLRDLFRIMAVGMSFVVPRNLAHVAKHIATKEFEAYRIRTSATSSDKRFFRIFRVA